MPKEASARVSGSHHGTVRYEPAPKNSGWHLQVLNRSENSGQCHTVLSRTVRLTPMYRYKCPISGQCQEGQEKRRLTLILLNSNLSLMQGLVTQQRSTSFTICPNSMVISVMKGHSWTFRAELNRVDLSMCARCINKPPYYTIYQPPIR